MTIGKFIKYMAAWGVLVLAVLALDNLFNWVLP